ncbi:hypothetical protein EV356DRAFT_536371 [Viridothelium virens]|uniref:DUF6594 domain-containing protein n=1 Tax=Viridothelium virens TaxID=1048519 RepID=A0A6A6GXW4_VIRVR|nr:hypothetical protein EV356DRAFT_536371 [Viridothelium virens]
MFKIGPIAGSPNANDGMRIAEEGAYSPTHSSTSTQKTESSLLPHDGKENHLGKIWGGFFSFWLARSRHDPPRPKGRSIVRQLEECPRGYPNAAAFLDSDENFMIYRRFGYLQSRLLLDKQDELRKLENKLDRLDTVDARDHPKRLTTTDLKAVEAAPRKELLKETEVKFREYASLLTAAQQMMSLNRPARCDYQSVVNYMDGIKPVVAEEAEWVHRREDLITLRHRREHAWLDSGIEHLLKWIQCKFKAKKLVEYLFCSAETKGKSRDPDSVYYDRERINYLASGIIILAILILLIVPIYILFHLITDVKTDRSYAICIGILVIFTLSFSAVLSLFTRAKRHEILGAAAAYCAVLVVFFGNVGNLQ